AAAGRAVLREPDSHAQEAARRHLIRNSRPAKRRDRAGRRWHGAIYPWPIRSKRAGGRGMSGDLLKVTAAGVTESETLSSTLLGLNNAHAVELSWLEPGRLRHLVAAAFLAKRIGEVDAFLLTFDQDADYDSPNFLWFRSRYPRFVYVDRIVVA